jgi:hypothetical protein
MPIKWDVADWMQTHTVDELRKLITSAAVWKPAVQEQGKRTVFPTS